jgi:hypothetical protein
MVANAFGGTFAKPHKPNPKAKFCKRATKPTHQDTAIWTDNNSTEKKHEPVTSCIKHLADSGLSSDTARIKSSCNLIGFRFEMPNVSYTQRLAGIKNKKTTNEKIYLQSFICHWTNFRFFRICIQSNALAIFENYVNFWNWNNWIHIYTNLFFI